MITIDVPLWSARLRASRRSQLWSRRELGRRVAAEADEETRDRLPGPEELAALIRRWETGERAPDECYTELLCRAFGESEEEVFVGEAAGTTLWHHLTGIPLLPQVFTAEDEERTGRAIENPQRADRGTVGYFETVTNAYAETDLSPRGRAAALLSVFAGLQGFHRDARTPIARALLMLAERNAELISRMQHEADRREAALAWSDEALGEAKEAGDTLVECHALIQRAGLVDTGAEAGRFIDLAVAAREQARLPGTLDAEARHHEAVAHALAGDAEMCHRRLEESAESLAEAGTPVESGERVPYLTGESVETHSACVAECLIDLGRAEAAIEVLEQAALDAPEHLTAYTMARMAHAYADAHEGERAADLARRARALARRTGAARALRELDRFWPVGLAEPRRRVLVT